MQATLTVHGDRDSWALQEVNLVTGNCLSMQALPIVPSVAMPWPLLGLASSLVNARLPSCLLMSFFMVMPAMIGAPGVRWSPPARSETK